MIIIIGALALGAAIGAALTSGGRKESASNLPVEEFDSAHGKEIIDFGFTGSGNPSPKSLSHRSPEPATDWKDGYWQNSARAWAKELWIWIKPVIRNCGSWIVRQREPILKLVVSALTSIHPKARLTIWAKALERSGLVKAAFV